MKRHHDIERILEEFKGVQTIPRVKSAKKRVLITKIKNTKGECITSRKGIADTFGEFYKRLYEDSGKTTPSKKRVMKKEYLKSRLKKYRRQSASSNLANLLMEMEYELKTSKIATKRREK